MPEGTRIPPDELDAGLGAAFGGSSPEPGASVLDAIVESGRSVRRVLLRDLAEDDAPVLRPRDGRTGRYQVVGEIARGGVGVILKGRDVDLGRDVALKVLREEYRGDRIVLERFVEEAQIGGQLQHPGIAPVYDLGLDADGQPFFSMKLVKGKTLAALLSLRPSPRDQLPRFLRVLEQVGLTMAYAHGRGVVHRDLKPANVLVGAFGEVQIVDWGLAEVLRRPESPPAHNGKTTIVSTVRSGEEGSASREGSVLGAPAYIPPEQARGETDRLDERCDVFALGAILCELLTGDPPYREKSGADLLAQAREGRLEDAIERLEGCGTDRDLIDLAKRCLAPRRADRPQDAGFFAAAVRDHLAGVEERAQEARVAAAEAEARARGDRRSRRLTLAIGTAIALTAAFVVGGWLWIEGSVAKHRERTATRVRTALAEAMVGREKGDWDVALAAARRADGLARAGDFDAATRAEVDRVHDEVREAADAARLEAERRERDAAFLAALEEIRAERSDGWDAGRSNADYAAAFAEALEVDVAKGRLPDRVLADLHSRPPAVSERIAAALDDWAWIRRSVFVLERDRWTTLVENAIAIDRDETRRSLRAAILANRRAAFGEIAGRADPETWPPATLDLLASRLQEAGDPARALSLLRAARRHHPDDVWINYSLGLLCQKGAQELQEAVRFLVAAAALRPRSGPVRRALGDAYFFVADRGIADEYASAIREYHAALERMPPTSALLNNLGNALRNSGRLEESVEVFRRAIRLEPENAIPHLNLALSYRNGGDLEMAIEEVGEAARLRPDVPEFREYVALFVEATGDPERTEKAWRDYVDRFPGHGRGWRRLGDVLENRGSFEGAIEAYEAAIKALSRGGDDSRTDLAVVRNSLAWLLVTCPTQRLRDPSRAKRSARAAVEALPQERSCWNTLGLALYRCGDLAGAVKALLESARLDPAGGDAWDWYVLAMARSRQGRHDEARGWYEKAQAWHEAKARDDVDLARLRAEAKTMLEPGEDD